MGKMANRAVKVLDYIQLPEYGAKSFKRAKNGQEFEVKDFSEPTRKERKRHARQVAKANLKMYWYHKNICGICLEIKNYLLSL
jgi:hypothetical protein